MILELNNLLMTAGLIVFAYISWRKIETGIYAIILLLPLYLVRANVFGIPTTALEVGIYILSIIWFIKNYRLGLFNKTISRILSDRLLLAGIFLLLAGAIISTVLSSDLKTSAGILKGWFFDPFLFFLILIPIVDSVKKRINVLKAISVSGLLIAIISLFYWYGFLSGGVSYDFRLHGFYTSPNYLAMYLAVPFIIAIWFHFRASGREKYFWLGAALVMAIPIYLTYSYAAWIAIFFSVFAMAYSLLKGLSLAKKSFLLAACFLAFVLLAASQAGTAKFENLKNLSYRSSTNSRLMIWRAAWMIGKDNPVFGIGPGNFQKYYLDYQKRFTEPYLEWAVPQPHNVLLAFWLETGILGLLGFILLLYWFFKKGISAYKKSRSISAEWINLGGNAGVAMLLFSVMAYIVIHGFFDTTYWKNDLAVIFWVVVGLMLAGEENS